MQQMDCINQQARDSGLTKRSQAERLVIADSLIASVWKEYLNGSIDRSTLQVAAYIQTNVNRIVWKLNELNNPNTPNTLKALDCISRQAAIDVARDWYEGLICGSFKGLEKRLRALPSAQPEIIRCKDCKWWDKYSDTHGYCLAAKHGCWTEHWDISIRRTYDADWYCADAERREDGERE